MYACDVIDYLVKIIDWKKSHEDRTHQIINSFFPVLTISSNSSTFTYGKYMYLVWKIINYNCPSTTSTNSSTVKLQLLKYPYFY